MGFFELKLILAFVNATKYLACVIQIFELTVLTQASIKYLVNLKPFTLWPF